MAERIPLGDERISKTQHFEIYQESSEPGKLLETFDGYVTAGAYPDGALGEIFVRVGKAGDASALYDQWALAFSLALQHGADVDALCDKFINVHFRPFGATNIRGIRFARSVPDLICRWLKYRYGRWTVPSSIIVRDGCILLAKRLVGKEFGGLWETPGGKAELGETDVAALEREVREELGEKTQPRIVELTPLRTYDFDRPVIRHPCRIPYFRVQLHGEPEPLASQGLWWAPLDQLPLPAQCTPATAALLTDTLALAEVKSWR